MFWSKVPFERQSLKKFNLKMFELCAPQICQRKMILKPDVLHQARINWYTKENVCNLLRKFYSDFKKVVLGNQHKNKWANKS